MNQRSLNCTLWLALALLAACSSNESDGNGSGAQGGDVGNGASDGDAGGGNASGGTGNAGGGAQGGDGRQVGEATFECASDPRLVGTATMGRSWYGQVARAGSDLFVPHAIGDNTGVERVSLAADSPAPMQVVPDPVFEVAVDDGFLYYAVVDLLNNRLLRQPLGGGLATSIATGISSNMYFEGSNVLGFNDGDFGAFSTVDGSFTSRFSTEKPSSGWRTDGVFAYWALNIDNSFEFKRAPISGGAVETLGTVAGDPKEQARRTGFAFYDGYLYWTDGPDARLWRLPAAGGEPEAVWSSPGYTSAVIPAESEILLSVAWHGDAPAAEDERGIWSWDPPGETQRQVVASFPGDEKTAASHPLLVTANGCLVFQHVSANRSSADKWDIYVVAL